MTARSKPLHGIQAVIIDLDGTMVDTAGDFQMAINGMRNDLGLAPIDKETIVGFVGKGTEHLVRSVLSIDYPPQKVDDQFEHAITRYQAHYQDINGNYVTIYPGVSEGLVALKAKGLRLACVTNKPYRFATALLEKIGLASHFEIIYGGDSLSTRKPDPGPLLQVCKDFGLEPVQVVAIGDSSNDARAARAAGCRVLSVPYGYNHGESVHTIDSDGIVDSILAAAELLSD